MEVPLEQAWIHRQRQRTMKRSNLDLSMIRVRNADLQLTTDRSITLVQRPSDCSIPTLSSYPRSTKISHRIPKSSEQHPTLTSLEQRAPTCTPSDTAESYFPPTTAASVSKRDSLISSGTDPSCPCSPLEALQEQLRKNCEETQANRARMHEIASRDAELGAVIDVRMSDVLALNENLNVLRGMVLRVERMGKVEWRR